MSRARDKYYRLETKRNISKVQAPVKEDEIVALTATVNKLKAQINGKQGSDDQSTSPSTKKQANRKKDLGAPKVWRGIPDELKGKAPPTDLTKPVTIDDKKWYYCLVHEWCPHPFDDQSDMDGCFYNRRNKKNKAGREQPAPSSSSNNNGNDGRQNGRLVRALGAVINE